MCFQCSMENVAQIYFLEAEKNILVVLENQY